ncbi:MAG: HAMP domain-containing sensor histidine kinase [Bacteroidetes bacterium]|nr:HAMP domain-containing sensor histidine kinase [Bacteroidota bacterium]
MCGRLYLPVIYEWSGHLHLTIDDQSVEKITEHIILPAGFKRCEISVDFAFNTIFGAGLEYQLLGLRDTTMQLMYDNNKIVLQNLFPGKYQLRVRVVNHPEVPPLILNIEAAEYWYKTKSAMVLWFLVAGLLLWLILSWRISHARNAALEEVDKSRKELFTIISHDLRSPLKAYQGLAEVISYLLRKGDYERVNKLAQQIDSTGMKLDLLLDNLLNWNILQQEKLIVKKETLDIALLMNEHIPIYQAFCTQKNIRILFEYRNDCMADADKTMVALMIRNLLDNAIKNSLPEQNITVDVFPTEEQGVEMVVSNTFQEKDREKLIMISSLIRKKENWEAGSNGMGFGLRMVYLAAIKTGAELSISKKDNIVSFNVRFKQKTGKK